MVNKNKLTVSFFVFSGLIALGSIFRYMRIPYSDLTYIPYAIEMFLWFSVVFGFLSLNKLKVNKIDLLFFIILIFTCISFAVLVIRFGFNTQKVFFASYILPLSVYYYVRGNIFVSVCHVDKLLKIFTAFGLLFLLIEFFQSII